MFRGVMFSLKNGYLLALKEISKQLICCQDGLYLGVVSSTIEREEDFI